MTFRCEALWLIHKDHLVKFSMKESYFNIHLNKFQIHPNDQHQNRVNRGKPHHQGESFFIVPPLAGCIFSLLGLSYTLNKPIRLLLDLKNPFVPNSLAPAGRPTKS